MIWHVDKELALIIVPKVNILNLLYNYGKRGKHGRIMPRFLDSVQY